MPGADRSMPPNRMVATAAGRMMKRSNRPSMPFSISDAWVPRSTPAWFTNRRGRYKSPAIHEMTAMIWRLLIHGYAPDMNSAMDRVSPDNLFHYGHFTTGGMLMR